MTDSTEPDIAALLRYILQQQTAMVQVQAESVRLQRILVERLLGVSQQQEDAAASSIAAESPGSRVDCSEPPDQEKGEAPRSITRRLE